MSKVIASTRDIQTQSLEEAITPRGRRCQGLLKLQSIAAVHQEFLNKHGEKDPVTRRGILQDVLSGLKQAA